MLKTLEDIQQFLLRAEVAHKEAIVYNSATTVRQHANTNTFNLKLSL